MTKDELITKIKMLGELPTNSHISAYDVYHWLEDILNNGITDEDNKMTVDDLTAENELKPETISKVVNEFQKTSKKYTGLQIAVAFTILLRLLIHNDADRQLIDGIVDGYDIKVDDE